MSIDLVPSCLPFYPLPFLSSFPPFSCPLFPHLPLLLALLYRQSMDLVSTLNPCLEDLRVTQTKARASLTKSQGQWDKRKEMLDMLLPHDVVGTSKTD